MADNDRIMLWRHKATGDLFEVRITGENQTARLFRRTPGDEGITPPSGLFTDADHKLGAEIAAHSDEYEEVPMREIHSK
jgi:hypothetical protein